MSHIPSPVRSDHSHSSVSKSSRSNTCSSEQSNPHCDFSLELDQSLSNSQWIEFMQWSRTMDVIALIMHQTNNDSQHLLLQRCVGKWQNLLNIDLSQELDDSTVISISWRYDDNGVCLGLSDGKMAQYLIDGDNNSKITQTQLYPRNAVQDVQWMQDKHDSVHSEDANHSEEDHHPEQNEEDRFNGGPFGAESNINDINAVIQDHDALLSCTQLNPIDYGDDGIHGIDAVDGSDGIKQSQDSLLHKFDSNLHDLQSLTFTDSTNKFLSRIPSLPRPPRHDFRYKIDPQQNTLQHIMKKKGPPPIPRKSQPQSLPLLITCDGQQIQLHATGSLCVGTCTLNKSKPPMDRVRTLKSVQKCKSKSSWKIKRVELSSNLQCINTLIAHQESKDLFVRFIHTPIYHSRRNELLTIANHGEYIQFLLDQLTKLVDRHLFSRWVQACRPISSKIEPLKESLEEYKSTNSWKHELKHCLLVGSPSPAFLHYVQSNLNVSAMENGYKRFDQFINEMLEIIQKNLVHIIQELIFRCSELKGYALWMDRFGCFGMKQQKINGFIDKLSVLYLKLDQLQLLIADSKLNLVAFKNFLVFLAAMHNNEDGDTKTGFDKLDCHRIFAAIDYDLDPGRISLFLKDSLIPKKLLDLFKMKECKDDVAKVMVDKMKKKWKRFERYSFTYLIQDVQRSWKPILSALASNISKSFVIDDSECGLLHLSSPPSPDDADKRHYIYDPVDHQKDITFVTTDVLSESLGVHGDIHMMCLTAKRVNRSSHVTQTRLVLMALITENDDDRNAMSKDIWTDDFKKFENMISQFPARTTINEVKLCVLDIGPSMNNEDDEEETLDFKAMDVLQIAFVDDTRLAILVKLKLNNSLHPRSCVLSLDLKKADLDWNDEVQFDDGMAINQMAFERGLVPSNICIDEIDKYLFLDDVNAQSMTVSGGRNLVALSCDPNVEGKCTRLLVVDINSGHGDDSEDESGGDDDDSEERTSSDNQDSDLENVIDID